MLNYRLEVRGSALFVKLEEANSRRILYLDTLKALANGKDLAAIQFLIQLHLRANAGAPTDTLPFREIALGASSAEAIRLMAQTPRLFWRGAPLRAAAKPVRIFWKGEEHPDKSATLRAFLGEAPLEEAEAVFPGWAIAGGQWMQTETAVGWKWIEAFRKGSIVLDGVQKKRFLEDGPEVLWNRKEAAPLQVFPKLSLSDATGSFANLRMDYPGVGQVAFEDLAPSVGGRSRLKKEEAAWEKDLLEAGFQRKAVGSSRYYCPGEKAREVLRFLLELGWHVDAGGKKLLLQTGCRLAVSEAGGRLFVAGRLAFQEKEASIAALQKARLFIAIDGQSVGLLDTTLLPPLPEGVWEEDALTAPSNRIGEFAPLAERKDVEWKVETSCEMAPLDERFRGKLLPYQEKGIEWLSFLRKKSFSGLLSDEMGLGKTVQAVAFFSQLRTNLPILVVAPTSLLFNWQSEISRFWPSAKVYVHTGGERLRDAASIQREPVVLTSYAMLRQDAEIFSALRFEAIALDESQAIKSSGSLAAQAAYRLRGNFRLAISGTPIENCAEEMWSQFKFLMPDLLGERSSFCAAPPDAIRRRVKPFILKRTKEEVQIQLPEKIDRPLWVEMTEAQEAQYDETLAAFKSGLLQKVRQDGLQAHRMQVLEAILRLRQIACDGRLCGGQEMGAKAERLLEMAQECGKKTLVFSQFATWLRFLQKDLRAVGVEPLYLDGSTPQEERGGLVQRFQEEEGPRLFLVSLKAGGVGLNLTAAQNVLLLDPWWNEAVERQAIDRAHRIGQKNTLWVHRLLTPRSIEEKMLQIKGRKQAQADELLGGEASESALEELLALLD